MSIDPKFRLALVNSLPAGVPAPDDAQLAAMYAWYRAVIDANTRFNLTRVTDPAEAAVKHFADSLAVLAWVASAGVHAATVLDVGTGAGFPAAPLAITRPDWSVTAIDSTGKKARFVAETAARACLANVTAMHARAERWKPRNPFDLVIFKAVASMAQCLTDSRHLVRPGGYVVHFKTADVSDAEEAGAARVAMKHRFAVQPPFAYALRCGDEQLERRLRVFRR